MRGRERNSGGGGGLKKSSRTVQIVILVNRSNTEKVFQPRMGRETYKSQQSGRDGGGGVDLKSLLCAHRSQEDWKIRTTPNASNHTGLAFAALYRARCFCSI